MAPFNLGRSVSTHSPAIVVGVDLAGKAAASIVVERRNHGAPRPLARLGPLVLRHLRARADVVAHLSAFAALPPLPQMKTFFLFSHA